MKMASMRRFLEGMTIIEWVVLVVILLLLAGVAVGARSRVDERRGFMAACMQSEPEYQCAYKWKQMHP